MNLAHLRDRHRSHAPRTSRHLSQPFSGHGHGARARRLARLPEPVRGFVSAQWISNERTRFALVVCCVACSAIAIASCAMHGGPPIEYAWQVTTSRATYLEVIKDVYKVFVHTTVMLINTKSMSTGERTNTSLPLHAMRANAARATRELAASEDRASQARRTRFWIDAYCCCYKILV